MNQGDFFAILTSSPYLWTLYELIHIIEEIIYNKFIISKERKQSKIFISLVAK